VSAEQEGPVSGPTSGRAVADATPWQVRCAGWLVGIEALGALTFTAALAVRGASTDTTPSLVLGQAAFFGLIGLVLVAVARALVRGGHWARTPAIVTQLLLLPVVYSLIGPSRQPLLGVVTGLLVTSCFLLLISEAARRWMEAEGR
jgi:hypothetical protein